MSYRYRHRYYREYHSDSRVDKYFQPIIGDLKKYFFNLEKEQLNKLFESYKDEYGVKAYDYGIKTYYKWANGYVNLSDQTLLRLVKLIPLYLNTEQRYVLLEKIIDYNQKCIQKEYVNIETTWQTYSNTFYNILCDINKNERESINKTIISIKLPDEIFDMAKWIYADDMVIAQQLLKQAYAANCSRLCRSARQDLNLFKSSCDKLKLQNMIYDKTSYNIVLPTKEYCIVVKAEPKTIFGKIFKLFKS